MNQKFQYWSLIPCIPDVLQLSSVKWLFLFVVNYSMILNKLVNCIQAVFISFLWSNFFLFHGWFMFSEFRGYQKCFNFSGTTVNIQYMLRPGEVKTYRNVIKTWNYWLSLLSLQSSVPPSFPWAVWDFLSFTPDRHCRPLPIRRGQASSS